MSGHGTRRDKVIKRKSVEGTESAPQTFNGLIDCFGQRVGHVWIIVSSSGVLDILPPLEHLEALCVSIVNILGIGNELGRSRNVGSRHFKWRTG